MNGAPVPTRLPPVDALYQSITVPATLEADIVTDPAPHLEPGTAEFGTAGTAFIVAVTAVLAETQPVVVLRASA